MTLMTRSAMLQMRVTPGVKRASEQILHRIGLSMTEAMELFLRRIILDEKLPFEVVALDAATLARIAEDVGTEKPAPSHVPRSAPKRAIKGRARLKGG